MLVDLPVADVTVSALGLLVLGLLIGGLSGFFGVGGGFMLTPMLNVVFGIPYPIAVGSSLAQMTGTAVSGVIRHRGLGNVDYRLGALMAVGAVLGVEPGARLLEALQAAGEVSVLGGRVALADLVVSLAYVPLLAGVAVWMWWETRDTMGGVSTEDGRHWALVQWVQRLELRPLIVLPRSGIDSLPVLVPLVAGVLVGFLAGLLGVGGGFLVLPALVYVIGVPTAVAVGTSLFQVILTATMGLITHTVKGNVDPVLVLWVLVGGVVGAQVGAAFTEKASGPHIRRYFSYLMLAAALMVAGKLLWEVWPS